MSLVVGNKDSTVKNSSEFADFIRDKTPNACKEFVSFDVVSLFTRILVDFAVKFAEERLRDAPPGQGTSLPVEGIIHLLSFCLKTMQFSYNGTYYQRGFWYSYGFARLCYHCQHVNRRRGKKASATSPVKLFFWKRYDDDVISAVSGNEAEHLLSHLNPVEASIRLTLEREKNRHLSFLDLNVSRGVQGNLETSFYRKPTHNDKYLDFDSHHPICHKSL